MKKNCEYGIFACTKIEGALIIGVEGEKGWQGMSHFFSLDYQRANNYYQIWDEQLFSKNDYLKTFLIANKHHRTFLLPSHSVYMLRGSD